MSTGTVRAIERDRHGVGMAAQPGLGLEDRDGVAAIQQPSCGEAGNAGADDSDPHVMSSPGVPAMGAAGLGEDKTAAPAGGSETRIGWMVLRAVPLGWINGVARARWPVA